MLEQRRAKEKGFITLREAAEISGYSPDYVGQLIRSGKIKGEQVYSTVAWVTTIDELDLYKSGKQTPDQPSGQDAIVAAFITTNWELFARYALYAVIGVLCALLLVLQYVLYVSIDHRITDSRDGVEVVTIPLAK